MYFRYIDYDRVMVVLTNPKEKQIDLSWYKEGLAGAIAGKSILDSQAVPHANTLAITGKTPWLLN